jgi:hypothetical protein
VPGIEPGPVVVHKKRIRIKTIENIVETDGTPK